jgi:signal transduction histidine kinase
MRAGLDPFWDVMKAIIGNGIGWVSLLYILILFPDGIAFPRRLHRWLMLSYVLIVSGYCLFILSSPQTINAELGDPNPFFIPTLAALNPIFMQLANLLMLQLILFLPLIFFRYLRADALTRQQIKWLAFSVVMFVALQIPVVVYRAFTGDVLSQVNFSVLFYSFILAFPVIATGNAILRHRLYSIDIIINRTLVYGALTALVIGIYVLVVGTMSAVFQTNGSFLISLIATGVVAVSFHPLRERLQYLVDHYVYGERNNPYAVISSLSQRLETITAPGTLLPGIAETVAQALKLPFVSIALKSGDEFKTDAVYGQPADRGQITTLPLMYGQEIVGQMVIGQVAGDKPLDASQHQLLANIARQAGTAAHAVQLSIDLQQSRQQLVTAREEERRRLRRDLHDGLGPALAAHTIKVGAARALIESNPQTAAVILSELETSLADSLTDIRRLVYNLRPPALDQLGLIGALNDFIQQCNQRGNHATVFTLQSPEQLSALSAAVEVATYRIVQEGVNNVIRHAHARRCQVKIETNGLLMIHIQDDGFGLPSPHKYGVGLHSMRERSEELGGGFSIQNQPDGGTKVQIQLPLQSHPMKKSSSVEGSFDE